MNIIQGNICVHKNTADKLYFSLAADLCYNKYNFEKAAEYTSKSLYKPKIGLLKVEQTINFVSQITHSQVIKT